MLSWILGILLVISLIGNVSWIERKISRRVMRALVRAWQTIADQEEFIKELQFDRQRLADDLLDTQHLADRYALANSQLD